MTVKQHCHLLNFWAYFILSLRVFTHLRLVYSQQKIMVSFVCALRCKCSALWPQLWSLIEPYCECWGQGQLAALHSSVSGIFLPSEKLLCEEEQGLQGMFWNTCCIYYINTRTFLVFCLCWLIWAYISS